MPESRIIHHRKRYMATSLNAAAAQGPAAVAVA
jgi:hypothetical protein